MGFENSEQTYFVKLAVESAGDLVARKVFVDGVGWASRRRHANETGDLPFDGRHQVAVPIIERVLELTVGVDPVLPKFGRIDRMAYAIDPLALSF
jgi:hypothetical protein